MKVLIVLGVLIACPSNLLIASDEEKAAKIIEYRIKAVFLLNFMKFTEWPQRAFADQNSPYILAVLGTDPFGQELETLVKDKKIGGRPIIVRRYRSVSDMETSHLLFISASEEGRVKEALEKLNGSFTLTVSDMENFLLKGGMIRLLKEEQKIRFEINLPPAAKAELNMSSQLLKIAKDIKGSDKGE